MYEINALNGLILIYIIRQLIILIFLESVVHLSPVGSLPTRTATSSPARRSFSSVSSSGGVRSANMKLEEASQLTDDSFDLEIPLAERIAARFPQYYDRRTADLNARLPNAQVK